MSTHEENNPDANGTESEAGDERTGLGPDALARAVVNNLFFNRARLPEHASQNDWYMALAYSVRDRLLDRWVRTIRTIRAKEVRAVAYLSAEYLLGPLLGRNLHSLGIYESAREAAGKLGLDLAQLCEQEEEPGLGNGGLGRLAACFMDSLATMEVPAIGYGIRYEFGIFDQEIRDGWQVEVADKWLRHGNPWEIPRPDVCYGVGFGGHTEHERDEEGRLRVRWVPERSVNGVAHDTPVVGYGSNTTNLLRLWKAEAAESFDLALFNAGDYLGAVREKVASENITKILYPNDSVSQGRRLRLEQQYFFVSCSLRDMLRIHLAVGNTVERFHESFAVQLNDTHPSLAVAELMRLLVDEHRLDWDTAWGVTRGTFGYTNHTLLPEALERWPVPLFASLLPRHLEIVYEINRRFLDEVRERYPGDEAKAARLSLIDESGDRYVRMAHLASVGSHAINGVAALHSELLKRDVLRDFYELDPEKFHSITNGVTPRRWVVASNPGLAALVTNAVGDGWARNTEEALRRLEPFADDAGFREEWRRVKRENKERLARIIAERTGIRVDPASLFDVQVKRLHEYKRQILNVLHVVALYLALKREPHADTPPRTFIFGGKAAPGYVTAKLIIKLINSVAEVVNHDEAVAGRLKVVFFPDFNVKNGQRIYPAADLSEQISTAGMEASGTGNMKFALNGALTLGTLDGANVELREAVGAENFFLFGLTAEEVRRAKAEGYDPRGFYDSDPRLKEAIDLIAEGLFSRGDGALFRPLTDALLARDDFMLCADFASYVERQREVGRAYRDTEHWTRMSVLNVARSGWFSSDRAIGEYCRRIWNVTPVKIDLG